ncbi:MAG: N-acetylmuramoyl-L-alanine amidase [Verrucomicrobiaceae bacterium]|nr:N-acetylmuramoyl-L-alanine amidase [Verrucomicrobiaceae bacterium]
MFSLRKHALPTLFVATMVAVGAAFGAEEGEKKGWFDKMKRVVGLGKKEEAPPPPPPPEPKKEEAPKPKPKPKAAPLSTKSKSSGTSKASTAKSKPAASKTVPKETPKPQMKAPTEEKAPPPVANAAKTEEKGKKEATTAQLPPMGPPDLSPMGPPVPKEMIVKATVVPKVNAPTASVPAAVEPKMAEASSKSESTKESAFTPPVPAANAGVDMNLDSEFATLKNDDEPTPKAGTKATGSAPPPPTVTQDLPAAPAAWQIYQSGGMDWVTAESIHAFYRFSEFKVSGEQLWFRNPTMFLKGRVGSQDLLINNIKFVMSYPITTLKGKVCVSRVDLSKLLDPVIRPWLITQGRPFDTVIIDAGHGGHDSGAKGIYGYEKQYTLQLAHAVKAALIKRGFKVVMTRQDDRFISLGGRAQFANSIPNSIFVSLHFNSGGSAASGIETFALTPQGSSSTSMGTRDWDNRAFTGNIRDAENIALATAVHAMVIHRYKLVDRGIKRARWSVLTGCNRPGILFEGGFVTNSKDGSLIASPTYQNGLAAAIGDALVRYQAALFSNTAQKSGR